MSGIFIYQILTPYINAADLDPGFAVLDNTSNERPDWFEYWPIRQFLLNTALDDASFYGFFSPRFKQKTNLTAAAVRQFVGLEEAATDIVLLSPSLHLTAYHLNVFKYGDAAHPGLLQVADEFFKRIGQPTNLDELITTSRNEVYSNFFVARPRFWKAWLDLAEQLFAVAESPEDPLGARLRKPTRYRGGNAVQMKVFIMERLATWILARDAGFSVRVRDPFVARSRIYKLPGAIVCDALKAAYVTTRRDEYKQLFHLISRFGKFLGWQIRFGAFFGSKSVRACVANLAANWAKAARPIRKEPS